MANDKILWIFMFKRIKMVYLAMLLASLMIGMVLLNCSRTILTGTKWKHIVVSENDSLFNNRNIEILFVNSNKILLLDSCDKSYFGYSAYKNGNIRIDSYNLTNDCENTTKGMHIHSKLMDFLLDAAKYKILGDTLLIYSRAHGGVDKYTFLKCN
jgi:hypothetical protein